MSNLGTCDKSSIPHGQDGTCVNFEEITQIRPAPVEGVALPERIVTDHDRKAAQEYNCSPVRIGETDRLKTAEECCLERQLADTIADINIKQHIIDDALATIGVTKNERNEAIAQRDEARQALEYLYGKAENGYPCTENGDIDGSYMGNCVHLSYEEEERILALIGPGPSTKPLHDGKPSWQERATASEAALATARAQGREEGLREAIEAIDRTGNIIQYVPQRSKSSIAQRRSSSVDFREAVLALIPKK